MGSLFYRSGWWNGKLCFSKSGKNEMGGFSVIHMNRRELYTLDEIVMADTNRDRPQQGVSLVFSCIFKKYG